MSTVVLVWVLAVVPGNSYRPDQVFGDFAALADCERVLKALNEGREQMRMGRAYFQCVQVNKVVAK